MDHCFRLILLILVCAFTASAYADNRSVVSGYVGSHKLSYSICEGTSLRFHDPGKTAEYLAVTEVYPDAPGSAEYHYTVSADGIGTYERRHRGIGFGPETYFIRVKRKHVGVITIKSLSSAPIRILNVWTITQAEMNKLLAADRFQILGLAPASDDGESLVRMLAENLHPKSDHNISVGFSAEIRYANKDSNGVKREIENCARWSKKYSLPAMVGLVSWWSGTPLTMSDGEGGHFGDIKYQQVCYDPVMEHPEDSALAALLGDRYNRHYCLTVPNEWSSTPWLTMNSRRLNSYRYGRIDEAVEMLSRTNGGNRNWITNFYLENEPRYWDTQIEAGNDKRPRSGTMWADFNPTTVADAKRDGIDLNPADGLSSAELHWLHRNVGRYNQECADAVNKSLRRYGFAAAMPVYTHSLQFRDMFPGGAIGHPVSEWAYAVGARTGLEGMWSQPSDFSRVREWGHWANINREENDGRHIDEHLWDLRVDYMMGGDLYNSYNWNAIGGERFFAYVNEFLGNLPVVTEPPSEAKSAADGSIMLKTPMKLQAFTGLRAPVEITKGTARQVRLNVLDGSGRLIGSSTIRVASQIGTSVLFFDYAQLVESPCRDKATLKLHALDGQGKQIADAARFTDQSASEMKLSLDLRTQRTLSLAVIAHAAR